MLENLRKIIALLSKDERRLALRLLGMILVMAALEVFGVASIMPVISVLANPAQIETNKYLAHAYHALGFETPWGFSRFLGIAAFAALILSLSFKAATTYVLLHFTQIRSSSLSTRLVASYLHQPYEWFLNRHSADLGKNVLSEAAQVISGALIPLMQLVANGAVAVCLVAFLMLLDPTIAVTMALGLGSIYALTYRILRQYLNNIGKARIAANRERYQAVQEAFTAIKDVKIARLEKTMLRKFSEPASRFARHQATGQVIAQLPQFMLQMISFGGILLLVFYLVARHGGMQDALPILAAYALSGYRLMPALQHVYAQIANMRFAAAALDALHADLSQFGMVSEEDLPEPAREPMRLTSQISLEALCYGYPASERGAVNNLSLSIPAHSSVAFVGSTGSGKTTTADVILGLLRPAAGRLLVDGQAIDESNLAAWQRAIGYVPQQIQLSDCSVAENIAFGIPPDKIDQEAVVRAAKHAKLHDFITRDLPAGYQTPVGERGVRLSGGQRQRIGIARALYHDPQVLVLDEATSALDNITEHAIMEAIRNLSHQKTIIIIAHRLSTIRSCDCIYLLENGSVIASGTYDELLTNNPRFFQMANAAVLVDLKEG